MQVHHVGYLVKQLEASQEAFLRLGFTVEQEAKEDSYRNIRIAFLRNGDYRVELIEPLGADSPMYPLLKRFKNAPYHLCYETADLAQTTQELEANGYRVLQEAHEAVCIDNRQVVFLMHPDLGIIELLEC